MLLNLFNFFLCLDDEGLLVIKDPFFQDLQLVLINILTDLNLILYVKVIINYVIIFFMAIIILSSITNQFLLHLKINYGKCNLRIFKIYI